MKVLRGLTASAALFFALLGSVILWDAYQAWLDPNTYHFGTESMVAQGGEAYRSQESYLLSGCAKGGGFLLLGAGLAALAFYRKKSRAPDSPR